MKRKIYSTKILILSVFYLFINPDFDGGRRSAAAAAVDRSIDWLGRTDPGKEQGQTRYRAMKSH
jgi:hypothetical protein